MEEQPAKVYYIHIYVISTLGSVDMKRLLTVKYHCMAPLFSLPSMDVKFGHIPSFCYF